MSNVKTHSPADFGIALYAQGKQREGEEALKESVGLKPRARLSTLNAERV